MIEPTSQSKAQSRKPEWLQKLEAESWQAEMIISGIAIFGSLQLPVLIERLIDYQLFELPETLMWPAYFVNIYLYFGSIFLIGGFLLHFILRALWVGMVGFNSVFPAGIQRNTKVLSEAFLDRLIEDYGDVNGYIKRLDNICSSLFAMAFSGAYTMVAICISILGLLLVSFGIHYLLPQYSVLQILAVLGGAFTVFALANSVFAIKSVRESAFARRWHYPISMTFNRMIYNFAARPVLTIQYTSLTGSDLKRYLGVMGIIVFLSMLLLLPIFRGTRAIYLIPEVYWRYGSDPAWMRTSAYANTLEERSLLLAPMLEQDELAHGSTPWIFVPLPEREMEVLLAECTATKPEDAEGAGSAQRRRNYSEWFLTCAREYLEFELNGAPIAPASLKRHVYPNRRETGVLVYFGRLPTEVGDNLFTITHGYRNDEGEPRRTYLPFRSPGSPDATLEPTMSANSR